MSAQTMLQTFASPWRKWRLTNCTDTSFASKIPTITEPTGTGSTASDATVIDLMGGGLPSGPIQNGMSLCFFGAGSDTNTFSARLIGWNPLQTERAAPVTPNTQLWIPTVLVEVSVALSLQVGIAARAVINTDRFADTITLTGTTANAGVNVNIVSPANDTIAYMYVDLAGFTKVELITDLTGATNANALFRMY